MDANDLARWTRFAAKGGIGKCTALQDCVAQGADDLMFLMNDEVVVLLQLPQEDQYLGYCEGVVGRFHGSAVRFHGKLKKPVFAKRQSSVGSSSSRPISLSPRSPPTSSPGPSNAPYPKPSSSPASSPRVPSTSSLPNSEAKPAHSARISISSISPPSTRHHRLSHSRTASTASSSSHYSTHSRPPSRQPPEPMPIGSTHARVSSTTSARSVAALAGAGSDSGSEDTQHVSLPPKPPPAPQGATTTPALTDASSAHSSFLLTPAAALSTFPPTPNTVPASLFQGRARSGSEKLSSREEKARGVRRRSGSENSVVQVQHVMEDRWRVAEDDAIQEVVMQGKQQQAEGENPLTGASEISFKSMSVYSEGSAGEDEEEKETRTEIARHSVRNEDRGVLQEDVSDEDQIHHDYERAASVSGLSDLSDGGFGIGMTLLREDEDEDDSEGNDDREDEETAIGHSTSTKDVESDIQPPRTPRTFGMRVMNPSNESPSTSENESSNGDAEDDTVMPQSLSESQSASVSASTSATSEFPASSSSQTVVNRALPPLVRPRLLTNESSSTIASSVISSIPTEDEHWESDADIYDDYRYSRYSSHSPAQHSSRRASRGSTKSARSRASERPPLPDEETWRRGAEDGTPPRKSTASERSGSSSRVSLEPGTGGALMHHPTPYMRGAEATLDRTRDPPRHRQTSTPPPQNVVDMTAPATPGAASLATMSITSPLTRAFRQSDVSVYSRHSQDDEVSQEDSTVRSEETSRLSPRHSSPVLPQMSTEDDQPARSRSPALASSLREKIQNELRSKSPNFSMSSAIQPQLSVLTSRPEDEPSVVVLNESPVSSDSPVPASPDEKHLRVASPHSYIGSGSAPPSPLNPGFPPSPSSIGSFATTAPLTINKSPSPSPTTPRHPISPPAIPFVGVPPPGRPPTHMQYAQHAYQFPPNQPHLGYGPVAPSESLQSALRLAGQQRATTIHGHVQTDLLSAAGPVPISFLLPGMVPPQSLQPRPQPAAPQPPYGQLLHQSQSRTQSPILQPQPTSPLRQNHPTAIPSHPINSQPTSQSGTMHPQGRRPMTAPAPAPGANSFLSVNIPSPSNPPSPDSYRSGSVSPDGRSTEMPPPPSPSAAAPLPRANFFPKVGQVRPRSRSFSGFNSEITEKISQSLSRRSQEEGNQPLRPSATGSRPSSPLSATPTQILAPSPTMGSTRGKTAQVSRPAHGPSPLSLPPTLSNSNSPTSPTNVIVPPSPISRMAPSSVRSLDIQDGHAKRSTLRQTPSHSSLRPGHSTISAPTFVTISPQRRNSGQTGIQLPHVDDSSSLRPPSPLKSPTTRQSHESDRTHTSFTRSDISTPPPITNGSPSSSPLARSGSLRSKISISAMRAKGAPRNVREGASETPTSTNGPATLTDEETVQIKDMEFELVRPTLLRGSSDLHRSEESVDPKDGISVRTNDLQHDSSSVRSEALSPGGLSPSTDVRLRPFNTSPETTSSSRKGKAVEAGNTVQAHRDRELKWISTMNSSDAAQARKSKKIKKLLIDGVPSSVRYLVWAHLSNSGSKKMPNVYTQLSKRRTALAGDIERDVESSFPDHPHLRDPNGPLVSVLFAYIAMVPDLRYHRGLAIIAGNLLLQSPEEDAFWTFLAMMDSHLRPYFMPTSPQIGVDTSLFIKAAESADPQLAKHVFIELNVRAQELCSVWFTSVFAGTLPLGHLHRVWDMFFYEGVPFLFRVGLTLLSLCRRHFLESSKGDPTVHTRYLIHPPPEALPADPEQFISQALSVKLKDDEIRKMRLKLAEAAVKQLRAPRTSTLQPSHPLSNLQGERMRAS